MRYFPIFLDIANRRILILGGGAEAARKARLALKSDAAVIALAPVFEYEIRELAETTDLRLQHRDYDAVDLDGAALVYVATGDPAVDARLSQAARDRNIPVNVVDTPELCSFITPAIVDRDPLVIAIGTEGCAPVLAQGIKARLEALLPPQLGALVEKARSLRPAVALSLHAGKQRRAFWSRFFFGPIRDAFLAGRVAEADDRIAAELNTAPASGYGRVSLVGAGPGDPELLTLKAQRLLQSADVIVYDRLVGPGILEYARRDADRICVGKTPGAPSTSQGKINSLLIDHALNGHDVVRLKGGDPYLFGRGAEEQSALEELGIAVDIVPGITAAAGCAASIGLPLTRRGENRSLTLMTAMAEDGPADHDWDHLARSDSAFAIYMGVGTAARTRERLLSAGAAPETSVVIVENGTLPGQKTAFTDLDGMLDAIDEHGIKGPAIIYVGLRPGNADAAGTQRHQTRFEPLEISA